MKRIIRWLDTRLFRREAVTDRPSNPESAKPDEIDLGLELPRELQDLVDDESIGPVDTVPNLEIATDTDETTEFDPYDTAKTHKK